MLAFDANVRRNHPATTRVTAMVFDDPVSRALRSDLDRLSPSEATLLIQGETGTGKELVARYVHACSKRAGGPFVAVNCGALTENLAEAELFGHEKGAFTGATGAQAGWFESANGGTLLLDEIGDLPLALQVKLLRVLQEREVVRVGSRTAHPIDVRVIAATNVDLGEAIAARRFREDLYFRLTVATVRLSGLKDRRGDIVPLAKSFLRTYADRLGRHGLHFAATSLMELERHDWPGNIRELENIVHNAVLLAKGPAIQPNDLKFQLRTELAADRPAPHGVTGSDIETCLRRLISDAILQGEPGIYDRAVASIVRAGFDMADGNQIRASELLGISRNALRTHLSHLGVIARRRRTGASPSG